MFLTTSFHLHLLLLLPLLRPRRRLNVPECQSATRRGATGCDVAANTIAHARSWVAMKPKGQRKTPCIAARQHLICLRHLSVGSDFHCLNRHLTLPNDGTRVGGRDCLTFAGMPENEAQRAEATWSPHIVSRDQACLVIVLSSADCLSVYPCLGLAWFGLAPLGLKN